MIYTKQNNIEWIMLSIDFEKAFDSLKWSYLDKWLKSFNFEIKIICKDVVQRHLCYRVK